MFSKSASLFSQLFVEQFFVWNRSWLGTTEKVTRWYDSYQAFQCNMLSAWIKGTFNGEEGLGQESSVQSIMYLIIGYISLRVSGILYFV